MTLLGATAAEWQASLELAVLLAAHVVLTLLPVVLFGLWGLLLNLSLPAKKRRRRVKRAQPSQEAQRVVASIHKAKEEAVWQRRATGVHTGR